MSETASQTLSNIVEDNKDGFFATFVKNVADSGRYPRKTLIGFFGAWTVFFLILFVMPTPAGLSPAGKATLAVVAWACITWISEAIPVGISGVIIPMLLVMSGAVAKYPQAVGGFTSTAAFICLVAFILAAIIQVAGLDRRIALTIMHKMNIKKVGGVIWSLFGVNFILSFMVPGANPRGALLLPLINGITRLFGDTPEEQAAKKHIVIQALVYSSMISGMCILTAHLPNLVIVGLFQSELKLNISFAQWFLLQFPYLGMFVLTHFWLRYYFKSKNVCLGSGCQVIKDQFQALPKMSQSEKIILAIFAFTAIMWGTESLHKIKSHDVAIIGLALLFIPGIFGFKWQAIQDKTIWGTFLMLGGALSMSAAMGSSGLAKWLAELIHPIAAGHSWWLTLLILMVGTHFIRLGMLSNVAAITLFAPILISLAPQLGLHPVAFTMLVADTDTFAYILPTQVTVAVIAYSSGTFSMADYAKVGWVSVLIAIGYGILVMAPWYAVLGLPVWNPQAPWPF